MASIALGLDKYRDQVLACWMGKNIGGTLGGPLEGQKHTHALTFYEPVPEAPLANDDLEIQIVWLLMLEDQGLPPSLRYSAADSIPEAPSAKKADALSKSSNGTWTRPARWAPSPWPLFPARTR